MLQSAQIPQLDENTTLFVDYHKNGSIYKIKDDKERRNVTKTATFESFNFGSYFTTVYQVEWRSGLDKCRTVEQQNLVYFTCWHR